MLLQQRVLPCTWLSVDHDRHAASLSNKTGQRLVQAVEASLLVLGSDLDDYAEVGDCVLSEHVWFELEQAFDEGIHLIVMFEFNCLCLVSFLDFSLLLNFDFSRLGWMSFRTGEFVYILVHL